MCIRDRCISNEVFHEIHCDKKNIYNIRKILEKNISNFISTDIEWIPNSKVMVSKENLELTNSFLEDLDDNDDVQNIYTNLNLSSN